MGNDGGSIPDRRDLVKSKPKAEQADKNNQTIAAWFFCALSKRPLQEPIVSCALGKLYNKDAILEFLLDKAAYGDGLEICGHIKSLKDVKALKLSPNPAVSSSSSDSDLDSRRAKYVCPLTLKEMNGALPFVYLATCGDVFSAAGLKAVSTPAGAGASGSGSDSDGTKVDRDAEACPQCAKPFSRAADVRTINPGPEEQARMREQMLLTKAASKASSKKRKVAAGEAEETKPKKAKPSDTPSVLAAPSMNPSVTSVARKVTKQIEEEEKKRKANMSSAVASLYGSKDSEAKKPKETFLTMGTFTRYA